MKIGWLVRVPMAERDGRPYSPYAGVRMRILLPAEELQRRGHATHIFQLPDCGRLDDATLALLDACSAVVFGPLRPASAQTIDDAAAPVFALIERLRQRGIATLADIHDDHFEVPGRSAYFSGLVQKADAVIVNSDAMAKLVAGYTSRPAIVIADPYEGPRGKARFEPALREGWSAKIFPWRARRLQLTWFGHQSNLQSVYDFAHALAAAGLHWPLELRLVSGDGFGAREFCEVFNHHHARRCRLTFAAWSPQATEQALAACDLAVIPGDASARKTNVKSANRVAEILRAGRLAIAYPIPAYREFADYAWIGEDLVGAIAWALAHRDEALARIRAGQAYVEKAFSAQAVGSRWESVLREMLSHPRGAV
jgi:glycosyltransferase involved in cell wall biosynthesis